jgi:hypothetical protein
MVWLILHKGDNRWPEANVKLVAGREKKKKKTRNERGKKETKSVLKQEIHSKTANMTKSDKEPVTGVTRKSR